MLRKTYPSGTANPQGNALKIIFLAEGYQAAQKKDFHDACRFFVERFQQTPPFNLTRQNPNWIICYSGFQPSSQSGAANNASSPGRTLLESVFDTASQTLSINQARLNAVIDDPATTLPVDNDEIPLAEIYQKGFNPLSKFATLVVVLLPAIAGVPETVDSESLVGENDYHFVATTTNNHWYQAVFRSIGVKMGLGDEFENAGTEFQSPPNGAVDANCFNLQYLDTLPTTNRYPRLKWRQYFSGAQKILPPIVHPKTGDTTVPDVTTDAVPVSPSKIEFWEGGGGFRTGIYRSAKDCLMRRRIGDAQLPVSARPVPFCHVCRTYLKSLIE